MKNKRPNIFLLLFFAPTFLLGQGGTFKPEGSFSIDVGIPTKNHNVAFGKVMEGLFNGGLTYQNNVFGGLTLGAGAKYSYFNISTFALNNAAISGGLHMPAIYGIIGYERFTTDRVSLNVKTKIGYSMNISANDTCKAKLGGPYTSSSFFVEPQLELVMLTDKTSPNGFSFVVGYNFYLFEFGPEYLCYDFIPNTVPEHLDGITRFISLGFGYRHYFGRN